MPTLLFDRIDSKSLKNEAYKIIKEKIIRQEIEPGYRLVEEELSEQLGISRTPIREAISKLKTEGLVFTVPRKGSFVIKFSNKDIDDLYTIRENLEVLAVKLATPNLSKKKLNRLRRILKDYEKSFKMKDYTNCFNLDMEFHLYLAKISNNSKLYEFLKNLEGAINVTRWINCKKDNRKLVASKSHERILAALENRDVKLSCKLMTDHIREVKQELLS